MTTFVVCAIRDSAMDAFLRPVFVPSVAIAQRSFVDEVNRAADDNTMYKTPDDFSLYELGSWDEATGEFRNLEVPRQVVRGKDCKR